MCSREKKLLIFVFAVIGCYVAFPAITQQILVDKPVKAGELTVFPSIGDDKVYYYISDKPKLANSNDNKPQFSFLRYVQNVRSGDDQPELREGEGGGIVHALVSLSVTEEQLQEAQRELQRIRPGARIEGPVVFRAGKFGLVSSFTDTEGNLTTQVVGLGNAPLLDGEKAAVSIQLTRMGAEILWESFHTPTPDISFSFEMDVAGFRSPHRAKIEADFDQIYDHNAFGVGFASTYLAAEIKGAFDDLRRQGAIKITQIGEDEKMDELINVAYKKITDMMFSPVQGTGTPGIDNLTGAAGGQGSLLDRASSILQHNREETRRENERIRQENEERRRREASEPRTGTGTTGERPAGGSGGTQGDESKSNISAIDRERGVKLPAQTDHSGIGTISHEEASNRELEEARKEVPEPSFAVVASFEMKRIRQQGKFAIDLNKYTSDTITLRFDENIGDLTRFLDDGSVFHQVNLDDPLYRQRELVASLDGMNANDFGNYINFVTVNMRKRHASGEMTNDEARIDRDSLNNKANRFKLLYGWKGDNDRRRWMEYEYKVSWSFFGGRSVEEDWKTSTINAIPLVPPYQRRSVEFDADSDTVSEVGIRTIMVRIFDPDNGEQLAQTTLRPNRDELSRTVDFILPTNKFEYDYEINWRLRGNSLVSSGRQRTSEAILFVDELPER